jgi:outer membrane protein OmpA-like peptidoglycan-associated protein
MRLLLSVLLACILVISARAQGYTVYAPAPQYYVPYANPNVMVVYPTVPAPAMVITAPQDYTPITYLIAFKDHVIRMAAAYWVSNNTLYYVTTDHQQRTAALDNVDRALSERLNADRAVSFSLPVLSQKAELRSLLGRQLSLVLDTQDTSQGLVVRISDVFFQFNAATLTPAAREKLAKVAGILVSYNGLCPRLEGHTDNIGTADYNLRLSRRRAEAVREYLISQGVPADRLTAVGFGSADPIASNVTAQGRQQNRRVELVISGDAIGVATMPTTQ